MNTIILIFFTLIFFIYSILMLVVVTAYKDRKYAKFLKKVDKKRDRYEEIIAKHLAVIRTGGCLRESTIVSMKSMLKDEVFVTILDNYLAQHLSDNEDAAVRLYMDNFKEEIIHNIYNQSKADDITNIHNVFRIGLYRLQDSDINQYLLDCLDTNSLYLKYNALRAIASIGNERCLVDALKYLSLKKDVLNQKVVLDILNNSKGKKDVLKKILIEKIADFSADIKSIVIEYFRIQSAEEVSNILLGMLGDKDEHMEVRLSIIRYFGRLYYHPAGITLQEMMFHSEWEYRALCASALTHYHSSETENTLLACIGDENWYVRYNTANTLLDYEIEDAKIMEIINSDDRYASDVMKYALTVKKRIVLEMDDVIGNKIKMENIC